MILLHVPITGNISSINLFHSRGARLFGVDDNVGFLSAAMEKCDNDCVGDCGGGVGILCEILE